jgi:hypothetical protein
VLFVDLEPRLLQVLYYPLGEQLAYIVGRVLIEQTAHQNRKGLSRFQPNPLSC